MGKRTVIISVIAVLLIAELLTTVNFNLLQGLGYLPAIMARITLTLVLCVLLFKGFNWARWIAVVLLGFTVIVTLVGFVTSFKMGKALSMVAVLLFLADSYCLLCLSFSSSIAKHFKKEFV